MSSGLQETQATEEPGKGPRARGGRAGTESGGGEFLKKTD